MRRFGSFVFAMLLLLGLAVVALVLWERFGPMRVGPATRQAVNRLEEAAMSRGRYLVQLRSMDVAEQDWTLDPTTGEPRALTLVVRSADGPEQRVELGSWRGFQSFDDDPVTFTVNYDPDVPILLEFRESPGPGGVRHTFRESWPFGRTILGSHSACRFTWKRIGPASQPPPSTADWDGP